MKKVLDLYEVSFDEVIIDDKTETIKKRKIVFADDIEANAYVDALHYIMDMNTGTYRNIQIYPLS